VAYDTAATVMNEVLGQLQKGDGLDSAKLKVAISPMIDSVMRNQDAMAWLVQLRKRDAYSYHHSLASSVWAVILGRHLGFDRTGLDTLAMGGLLLDLGKAQIPAEILQKPGPLEDIERRIVEKHVAVGAKLVRTTPGVNADVIAMIEGHHERHDGSGYPKGLSGADIPVFGRIAGLIDSFDAMTTKRPYAPAKSAYDAIRELNGLAGTAFQRELVEQFVQALGMFPSGSLVELNTGEVAIVIEQNRVRRLRPKIMLVLDARKQPRASHETLDLRKVPDGASQEGARWITSGLEPGAYGLDPKDYFA
jgi:HD-GYP domain-containing protein (c-di-GMP phosphodiesterase class II)